MTPKPDRCPECGSEKVASILYGLPMFDEELERQLNAEEVVLGGCTITDDDPLWHCVECQHRWGKWEVGIWEALEGFE
jgi:primosomal protein N'